MTRRAAALAVAVLLWLAAPAAAHRLDELLQATTIDVAADGVAVRLRLTPGLDVAGPLVAAIDADGDGVLSAAEQRAYAGRVARDLSLAIDSRPVALRVLDWSFPEPADLAGGSGAITLHLVADLPPGPAPRSLTFENRHAPGIAAYLVNALMPRDPGLHVVAQERSTDQSAVRLTFDAAPAPAGWRSRLARDDALPVLVTYAGHGIRHILTGYDHLLFVAALVLGAARLWQLVEVVTAFTLAHSATLALASLGLVHVPDAVVEPLIAASIVAVALRNILAAPASPRRGRLVVAFAFGLVHGLGFAGGLLELMREVPWRTTVLALLGFSVGIELGQQLVLLPLFGLVTVLRRVPGRGAGRFGTGDAVRQAGSAAAALAGTYYLWVALAAA